MIIVAALSVPEQRKKVCLSAVWLLPRLFISTRSPLQHPLSPLLSRFSHRSTRLIFPLFLFSFFFCLTCSVARARSHTLIETFSRTRVPLSFFCGFHRLWWIHKYIDIYLYFTYMFLSASLLWSKSPRYICWEIFRVLRVRRSQSIRGAGRSERERKRKQASENRCVHTFLWRSDLGYISCTHACTTHSYILASRYKTHIHIQAQSSRDSRSLFLSESPQWNGYSRDYYIPILNYYHSTLDSTFLSLVRIRDFSGQL